MWDFAGLFGSSARRSKRLLPGNWPDDASDSVSEVSVQEDAIVGNGTWFFNMVISYSLAFFTVLQNVYDRLFGDCTKCADIYLGLELSYEHLRFARNTCSNLEAANAELKKDSRLTRQLLHEVYRKLLGTADHADRLEKGVADGGDKLPPGHPELVNLRHEINEMRRVIAGLEKEKELLKETMDKKDRRHRQRRLDEKTSLMQKRICVVNARIEELLQANGQLACELERFKREPGLEEALKTAKEDAARYEAKAIRDKDLLREANRLLGICQSDLRDTQVALGMELERLQKDYDARVEALKQGHEQEAAAMRQDVNSAYAERTKEWEEQKKTAVAKAVAEVTTQHDRETQRALDSADKEMGELMDQIDSEFTKKQREWRRVMKDLSQENGALRERLEKQGKLPLDQVPDDVPKYLSSNDPPEQSKLVQELRTKIADLEAKLRMEQQEYQERLQAAVAEQRKKRQWDETFQEVLEERDRLRETLLYAGRERDSLLKQRENLMAVWDRLPEAQADLDKAQTEVAELNEIVATQAEEAEHQKKVVAELKEEAEGLRGAHDRAVASQEAVLEANTKLQSDLQMTRNQVDILVEQNMELEEDIVDLRAAREVADRKHARLLEAEKEKTCEAVAAANAARNASSRALIRREEPVSRREPSARASVVSRSSSVSQLQRLPRYSQPTMAASPFTGPASSTRQPLQQAEGRVNRNRDVATPSQDQAAESVTRQRKPSTPYGIGPPRSTSTPRGPSASREAISEPSTSRSSAGAYEDTSTFGVGRYCAIRTRLDSDA